MLKSTESVIVEVLAANGEVEVFVALDPQSLNLLASGGSGGSFLWKAKSIGGLAQVEMDTHDDNFHMATFYFVLIKAASSSYAIVSITLKQKRQVTYLSNNHDQLFSLTSAYYNSAILFQKAQFESVNEQMKYHVFSVPGGANQNYKAQIIIESLSDHFFPMLYLKR